MHPRIFFCSSGRESKQNTVQLLEQSIETSKGQLKKGTIILKSNKETLETLNRALNALETERFDLFEDKNPTREEQRFKKSLTRKLERKELLVKSLQTLDLRLSNLTTTEQTTTNRLKTVQENWRQTHQTLQLAIQETDFQDIANIRQSILSIAESQRIEQRQQQLQTAYAQKQQSLKDAEQQLTTEKEKALTTISVEELNGTLLTVQTTFRQIQQEIGGIKERLMQNKLAKDKAKDQLEAIESQQLEANRWGRLSEIIGMKNGKKFRVFAQGLTLKRLVQLANRHLKKLNARYFIEKRHDEDLQLDIVDLYQANTKRSMSTLSGGESFLVSLALALGLSDLAGKNTQIESLFIDEGFGTLDEKTLDIAIETLENLQAKGKTIGVISHVRALKERISTQIQVIKKGGGMSTLRMTG